MAPHQHCEKCNGLRHTYTEGVWNRCECLKEGALVEHLLRNAVPPEFIDITLDKVKCLTPSSKRAKNDLKRLMAQLLEVEQGNFILEGPLSEVRLASILAYKAALLKSSTGFYTDLDQLASDFLSTNKVAFGRVKTARVLLILVGLEWTQKVHKYLMNFVSSWRRGSLVTIWGVVGGRADFMSRYDLTDTDFWNNQAMWTSIGAGFGTE